MNNEIRKDGDGGFIFQDISDSEIIINKDKSGGGKKPPPLPKHITTQSLTPPQYFTGREDVIENITNTLETHRKASLSGVSGLGKSSVVLEYAEEKKGHYEHLIFIRVDRTGFDANVNQTCEILGVNLTPEDNEESKALKFCRKIEEICENLPKEKRLLLIFDNVDEVERLRKFLPAHANLHLLFTSNFDRVHRLGHEVEIADLAEDEAMLLLYRVATLTDAENLEHITAKERETVKEIVGLFGFHPLAIFIAGNYIDENKKTFAKYLERLRVSNGKILKDGKGVDAYQNKDIYTAFEFAFNAICDIENKSADEQVPILIARECMKIASVLAPDNMPEEVFWETLGLINSDWQEYLTDEDNRDKAYQKLSQYKLFERYPETNTFSDHRLVRLFFDDRLKNERDNIDAALAQVLADNFEYFDFTNKEIVERYLPHVGTFLEYLEANKAKEQAHLKIANESTANLCNSYARYYDQYGQYARAEKYYLYFKDNCESVEDIDESITAVSYNNLAELYRSQGRYKEAEPLYKKARAIIEKALGENHLSTATRYNNLAGLYHSQGRYDEAEPLYKKALAIREKALGENHPDTAASYNNLALLYTLQGRYDEAEPLYKKALAISEKELGENHPSTAASYNNLAVLYESQGRYDEAESLKKNALAIREKALGENHPDTATSYNNLAELYRSQGRYKEAEPLYKKARAIIEKALGENHPNTAASYNNLAGLYTSQGRYDEVEPLFKKALAISEKALGENHPNTAASYMNLGGFYHERGKFEEALVLCEKALRIFKKSLPAGHPTIQLCEGWVEGIKKSIGK